LFPEIQILQLIIKADVKGTVDAVYEIIKNWPKEEVDIAIVNETYGKISNNDIDLTRAINGQLIGLNVTASPTTLIYAKNNNVPLITFNIIYHFIDYLKGELSKLLPKVHTDIILGEAQILKIFHVTEDRGKISLILGEVIVCGCKVISGKIIKNPTFFNVKRNKYEEFNNITLKKLKHFKDDVVEVKEGQECGISFKNFSDPKVNDIIQCVQRNYEERTFDELIIQHQKVLEKERLKKKY
jgi:translation initiation factor IF-2